MTPITFGYPTLAGGGSAVFQPPSPPLLLTADRWVSPTGVASGPGSFGAPWSIQYVAAGAGGLIQADVNRAPPNNHCYIFAKGGEYHITGQLNFTSPSCAGRPGTGPDVPDGKVILRNNYGEVCVISGGDGTDHNFDMVRLVADYMWIWGFDVYWKTWAVRTNAPLHVAGLYLSLQSIGGSKFIHMSTHDLDNGMTAEYFTAPNIDNEYYGNLTYNNGLDNSSPGGNGHGFYCRHDSTAGYLNSIGLIAFDQFGLNYQIYDQSNALNHMRLLQSIGFNAGMRSTIGGPGGQELVCWSPASVPHHHAINDNAFFKHSSDASDILSDIGKAGDIGSDFEIARNYMVHMGVVGGSRIVMQILMSFTPQQTFNVHDNFGRTLATMVIVSQAGTPAYQWTNNEWRRDPSNGFTPGTSFTGFQSATGLGGSDTCTLADPTVTKVFVKPVNKYEYGRAHICYFNWGNLATIPVALGSVLNVGDVYAIFDVRDMVNPVVTGTYDGSLVQLPTTQKPPIPIVGAPTGNTPPQTAPMFNAFVCRVPGVY